MKTITADSVIFDLDGTLWNAAASARDAWNTIFRNFGYHQHSLTKENIESFSGLPVERIFSEYFTFIPKERHPEMLTQYKVLEAVEMERNGGDLYPQVKEILSALKEEFRLFIVSNCIEGYIEHFIRYHELKNIFTDFECSGNTKMPKSHNIGLIIERNELKYPVYLGDTLWDQEACAAVDIPFIHAAYGFGKGLKNLYKVNSIADLPAMLKR